MADAAPPTMAAEATADYPIAKFSHEEADANSHSFLDGGGACAGEIPKIVPKDFIGKTAKSPGKAHAAGPAPSFLGHKQAIKLGGSPKLSALPKNSHHGQRATPRRQPQFPLGIWSKALAVEAGSAMQLPFPLEIRAASENPKFKTSSEFLWCKRPPICFLVGRLPKMNSPCTEQAWTGWHLLFVPYRKGCMKDREIH